MHHQARQIVRMHYSVCSIQFRGSLACIVEQPRRGMCWRTCSDGAGGEGGHADVQSHGGDLQTTQPTNVIGTRIWMASVVIQLIICKHDAAIG